MSSKIDDAIRLLLVEDNVVAAAMILQGTESLTRGMVTVHHAETLAEARRCLSTYRFDAVILDLNLPDSPGGIETVRIVNKETTIPIVVLTGSVDPSEYSEAIRAGAEDFLIKQNFRVDDLLRAIKVAIERASKDRIVSMIEEHRRRDAHLLDVLDKATVEARNRAEALRSGVRGLTGEPETEQPDA